MASLTFFTLASSCRRASSRDFSASCFDVESEVAWFAPLLCGLLFALEGDCPISSWKESSLEAMLVEFNAAAKAQILWMPVKWTVMFVV